MPLRSQNSFFRLLCFSFCLQLLLCATGHPSHADTEAIWDQRGSESFKESQKAFADRNPTIVSNIGNLELTVRMATIEEIPKDNSEEWRTITGLSAGFIPLGLVASPIYASALVVGGVLLVPMGTYLYFHDKGVWDSINGALTTGEFTPAIDSAIKDRLNVAFAKESAPRGKIEMIIQAFGLANSSSMPKSVVQHCFVAEADFILSRGGRVIKQEQLRITDINRSEDAPPPQCATLEHFAKNEATLIKDTLAEYAGVLAVMAVDRIPREGAQ